jgi:Na+-transporting NADH:ubiquinone oxidoreductase subunit NqrF
VEYEYRYVIIETFYAWGEPSRHRIRARPLPGQGLPTTMRVECSARIREAYRVGTKFKILARIKYTDQNPHLYSSYKWSVNVISEEQAAAFIKARVWT